MSLYKNCLYMDDVEHVAGLSLPWEKLDKVDEIKRLMK